MFNKIALVALDDCGLERAQYLARESNLPLVSLECALENFQFILAVMKTHVELRELGVSRSRAICVDFLSRELLHRVKHSSKRRELIARAIGLARGVKNLKVLDATAGFGTDSYMLAFLGCEVTMVERSPAVSILLADGWRRLKQAASAVAARMTIVQEDALIYLQRILERGVTQFDVVYLDPIYPREDGSALNKRKMRVLRNIVGDDFDASALLTKALKVARRVVVKRSRHADFMGNVPPSLQFLARGGSTRYDVYFTAE